MCVSYWKWAQCFHYQWGKCVWGSLRIWCVHCNGDKERQLMFTKCFGMIRRNVLQECKESKQRGFVEWLGLLHFIQQKWKVHMLLSNSLVYKLASLQFTCRSGRKGKCKPFILGFIKYEEQQVQFPLQWSYIVFSAPPMHMHILQSPYSCSVNMWKERNWGHAFPTNV